MVENLSLRQQLAVFNAPGLPAAKTSFASETCDSHWFVAKLLVLTAANWRPAKTPHSPPASTTLPTLRTSANNPRRSSDLDENPGTDVRAADQSTATACQFAASREHLMAMKTDILRQYVSAHSALLHEKAHLEARLRRINQALGQGPSPPARL
jgi:hypothetical protein